MAFAAFAAAAHAQEPGRTYRLGHLALSNDSLEVTRRAALPELARRGFSEGRNLVVDSRIGPSATLAELARAMIANQPDVIIAIASDSLQAAASVTRTVPIVVFGADPVGMGLAASHARPGGNVTGVVILTAELDAKRLDLLREGVPHARRIAVLLQRNAATRPASERELRRVAASAGVELLVQDAATADDYAGAFTAMRAAGAQALLIGAHAQFNGDRDRLAALALAAGLPTACEWAVMARAGCLIGYGPDQDDLRRRLARYVAAIFGGARPGELPIETPTRFEFAINLRTARALNLAVPPTIMIQADEVIE